MTGPAARTRESLAIKHHALAGRLAATRHMVELGRAVDVELVKVEIVKPWRVDYGSYQAPRT